MAKLTDVEGLDEALAEARTQAHAAGRTEGYAAGRKDAASIMADPGNAGLAFAGKVAADPGITVEAARDLIASVPEPKAAATPAADYRAKLASASPDVGPNTPPASETTAREARMAQLAEIGKQARKF